MPPKPKPDPTPGPKAPRAKTTMDAVAALDPDAEIEYRTRAGRVVLKGLKATHHGQVVTVECTAQGEIEGPDPQFRLINPPTTVHGDTEPDPLRAIAEVIGQHGGAQLRTRGGRKRG